MYIFLVVLIIAGSFMWWPDKAHAQTDTFTTSGTWSTPGGVTSATVEIWGAGAGGVSNSTLGGGGGGGGAYAKRTITTSGNYNVVIGSGGAADADGQPTYMTKSGGIAVIAPGGIFGSSSFATGGKGGASTSSAGSTSFSGGAGANGATGSGNKAGGGGGSSAGTASNGTNASGTTAGTAPSGGGNGGSGGSSGANAGSAGSLPGGGGGGGGSSGGSFGIGGVGGTGKVTISYTGGPSTFTTAGATTFTVPGGVTSIDIECWGAGGGGAAGTSGIEAGGGGGGGAYAKTAGLTVSPGQILDVIVGSGGSGGASFNAIGSDGGYTAVYDRNGASALPGRTSNAVDGGDGGGSLGSVGDATFIGGGGGRSGASATGGGGGSSAGTAANGNNGGNSNTGVGGAGGTAPSGGYAGGTGSATAAAGSSAPSYGGGGGGSGNGGGGGAGGSGIITITYTASNSAPNAPTLSTPSSGATGISITPSFTLSSTDPDSDTIKYRLYLYQSNCSTVVGSSPFAQSTTPTGWDNSSTAYASGATATYTYQSTLSYNTTYCWKADAIDPSGSNSYSTASSTRLFTTVANSAPAAPTLSTPSSGATGVSVTPAFTLSTTDTDNDYVQFRIYLYQSDCSTAISGSPFDMSGAGWSGMDANGNTAFGTAGPTTATYNFQSSLSANTTYCWKADAIDPGGSNTYSTASAARLFTTAAGSGSILIQGGVDVRGGSTLQ